MKTIDLLKPTLSMFPAEYTRGRDAEPALAPYASPRDVLAALRASSAATPGERDAITLALIGRHQQSRHTLWSSLLLVAYEPMFARLLGRLHDTRDADARIVLGFLEAIARVPVARLAAITDAPRYLALDLRRSVERSVFGTRAASRKEPRGVPLDRARRVPDPASPEDDVELAEQWRLLKAELVALCGDDADDVLDVLVHARTGREPLIAYVAERYPALRSKERAVAYARLERLRRRALLHLEARFGRALDDALSYAA